MAWRVDVRAGVDARVDRRDVGVIAARDRLDGLERERRVARIGWQARIQRNRNVDQLHGGERVAMIAQRQKRAISIEMPLMEQFDLTEQRRLSWAVSFTAFFGEELLW